MQNNQRCKILCLNVMLRCYSQQTFDINHTDLHGAFPYMKYCQEWMRNKCILVVQGFNMYWLYHSSDSGHASEHLNRICGESSYNTQWTYVWGDFLLTRSSRH